MLAILSITSPIFLLIGLGYVAVRARVLSADDIRSLGQFVLNFAMPALLLHALMSARPAEILNWPFLTAYAVSSLALMAVGVAYAAWRGRDRAGQALIGMGMCFCNSGLVGYPIVLQLFGQRGVIAIAMAMLVENCLLMTSTLALAESGRESGRKVIGAIASRLLHNPIILALIVGSALAFLQLPLPGVLSRAVELMAQAAGPVALFAIGGGLVGLDLDGTKTDVAAIVIGKLIVHPLAMLGMLLMLPPITPYLAICGVTIAALPMLSIYPLFGHRYGHPHLTSAAMLSAVALSFVTISMTLWLIDVSAIFGPLR